MKMKLKACLVALGMMLAVAGCGAAEPQPLSNDYITISAYKGIEVPAVEGLSEITDESVDKNIEVVREGFAEYEEVSRPAQDGDMIVLNIIFSVDGKVLENKSASNYRLNIGGNSLYEGFDQNIIGKSAGDTFAVEHLFDPTYQDADLAGKDVRLNVKIKAVCEKELPDLTDEFVQTISAKSKTVKEYREEMRALLIEQQEEYIKTELLETTWAKILENTEVKAYPEDQLEAEKQSYYNHYKAGADLYGVGFEDFLASMDVTVEKFEESVTKSAELNVKEDLIVSLIAETEGISFTDEEYAQQKEALAKEMSYESVEEMEKEAPADAIRRYIMRNAVKEWVVDNCKQVKAK